MNLQNAMLIVFMSTVVSIASGCNSSDVQSVDLGSGDLPSTTSQVSSSGPCTVATVVNGVQVSCPDGTSGVVTHGVTGSTGAQGAVGPTGQVGPTGAVGRMVLRNGTGTIIGSYLTSYLPTASGTSYTVYDSTNDVSVSYLYTGQPWSASLYFVTTNCSGTGYLQKYVPQSTAIYNNGAFYKATTTVANPLLVTNSYLSSAGVCTTATQAADTYTNISTYSNASVPLNLTFPVKVEQVN